MTLEQIYALSPTIAALALVLSLIYASLQFRINTKVARNARLIAAAAVFQDFSRLLASNAERGAISLAQRRLNPKISPPPRLPVHLFPGRISGMSHRKRRSLASTNSA